MSRIYVEVLHKRPVLTNACAALVVAASGDCLSQWIERRFLGVAKPYDAYRSASLGVWGFVWMGPSATFWYRLLEQRLGPGRVVAKVFLNQLIMAPAHNGLFYLFSECTKKESGLLERYRRRMNQEFLPTMMNSMFYWIPTQALNFTFVAPHLRPLVMNLALAIWTANVSYRGHRPYKEV